MTKPEFWRVEPNPICCTCFDENNKATGLIAEKGGEYVLCPDCSHDTCYGCLYSSQPPKRNADIWCAKHSMTKSPYEVCGEYAKR